MEFDFGLSALGEQFHMDWVHSGANPREVVRHWAGMMSRTPHGMEELRLLQEDICLLLASPLSDEEVHALWRVSAPYYPDFAVEGEIPSRGRVWLADVNRELRPFLPEPASERPASGNTRASVQSAVIALAARLTPTRLPPFEPIPANTVIAAVERCATLVSAALAFRCLLRAYSAYNSPVSADAWSTFEEVNHIFGYGEFMLSTIEYLREE
ncbi:hypothetical protein [Streptomyces sp. YS-3]|uniref:hypothetical protein n=1 Tax=Streptomyces sp. YS-3 TaxID=3381352 RepID=UPI0038629F12